MRRRGILLVLAAAVATGVGVAGFLAQRPPADPRLQPTAVAKVAEVAGTPRAVQVVFRRGADRVLQRERTGFFRCGAGMTMGCPGSVEPRAVTIFLVRDDLGALHAFIGEDPRTGCAIEWKTLRPEAARSIDGVRVDALFSDVCHGSQYDRRGRVVGGPSPWDLNALAIEERGVDLYVDPANILVGACRGCP